jgi:hypothetical protein
VLSPDGGPGLGDALALAEKAVAANGNDYYARRALAAALLRLARPEEAIQVLKRDIAESLGIYIAETSGLLGTVTHHRLGHPDDARRLLDRVVLGIEQRRYKRPMWGPVPWSERLSVELLRREAEALVKGAGAGAGPPAAKEK